MPVYEVKHYNGETGFLHSQNTVTAADEKEAVATAEQIVCEANGYGVSRDGQQAIMAKPRFRTAVTLLKEDDPEEAPEDESESEESEEGKDNDDV